MGVHAALVEDVRIGIAKLNGGHSRKTIVDQVARKAYGRQARITCDNGGVGEVHTDTACVQNSGVDGPVVLQYRVVGLLRVLVGVVHKGGLRRIDIVEVTVAGG